MIIASTFSLTSCKKKVAPILPPESTFVFDDLSDDQKAIQADLINSNAPHAFIQVGFWTFITTVTMAIPVTAHKTALAQEPVHVSGNKWVWEYQFGIGLKIYTFQLYGETEDNEVTWEMYISLSDEFDKFLWYTGKNNVEATAGYWTIYESPSNPVELVRIDWTHNNDDNTGTIKYTNVKVGDAENGGYIYYGNDQSGTYNSFYDIFNKGKDLLVEIEYNTETHVGRIKDFEFYEDEFWHCWDENFQDIVCEEPTK